MSKETTVMYVKTSDEESVKKTYAEVLGTKIHKIIHETEQQHARSKSIINISNDVEKIELIKAACKTITNFLVSNDGDGTVQKKVNAARDKGKNNTNIFEADLCERIIRLENGDIYSLGISDINKGYIEYKKGDTLTKVSIDKNSGISTIDIIKGPIGGENWMKQHNIKILPIMLQEAFRDKYKKEILRQIFEEKNNKNPEVNNKPCDESKRLVEKYIADNNIILPNIFVHFNRNWGKIQRRGKFAIELDWGGIIDGHAGILAEKCGKEVSARNIRRGHGRKFKMRGRYRNMRRKYSDVGRK